MLYKYRHRSMENCLLKLCVPLIMKWKASNSSTFQPWHIETVLLKNLTSSFQALWTNFSLHSAKFSANSQHSSREVKSEFYCSVVAHTCCRLWTSDSLQKKFGDHWLMWPATKSLEYSSGFVEFAIMLGSLFANEIIIQCTILLSY